ncbi:hypothetical protein CCP4SC76_2020037 [Gammaproteobacteria bacterium]
MTTRYPDMNILLLVLPLVGVALLGTGWLYRKKSRPSHPLQLADPMNLVNLSRDPPRDPPSENAANPGENMAWRPLPRKALLHYQKARASEAEANRRDPAPEATDPSWGRAAAPRRVMGPGVAQPSQARPVDPSTLVPPSVPWLDEADSATRVSRRRQGLESLINLKPQPPGKPPP